VTATVLNILLSIQQENALALSLMLELNHQYFWSTHVTVKSMELMLLICKEIKA